LGLAVALRAALLMSLPVAEQPGLCAAAIVASACFARLVVVAAMAFIPPVPTGTGLAKDIGGGVSAKTLLAGILAALPALTILAVLEWKALVGALILAGVFLIWLRRMLIQRIGGSTGDCLGFAAYAGQLILLLAVIV
jgi:adenosylcobinamide-GDP ribazoletransferase